MLLALLARATGEAAHAAVRPVVAVVLTRPQMAGLARAYLGAHDPADPLASPRYTLDGDLAGLPPVRVHVGEDELLLDDAVGYVARAAAAGADARVDVWHPLPHVFPSGVGRLGAAARAAPRAGPRGGRRRPGLIRRRRAPGPAVPLGTRRGGVRRGAVRTWGRLEDPALYAVLAPEWAAIRPGPARRNA